MSFLSEKEIVCPHCKHPNAAEAWSILNVEEDPELRELLIGGELNLTKCESCSKTFVVESFMMYHDPARELFVFVYPQEQEKERDILEAKAVEDFKSIKSEGKGGKPLPYDPLVLFGLSSLVDLIQRDEDREIQSDIALALAKENNWPTRTLPSFLARKKGLPPVFPLTEKKPSSLRDSLLEGTRRLLKANDALSAYASMLKQLEANPALADEWGAHLK